MVKLPGACLAAGLTLAAGLPSGYAQSDLQAVPRLGAPLAAGQLPPRDQPLRSGSRYTQNGFPLRVGDVTRWGPSCEPRPPTLVIAEVPQHGVLGMRDEPATIPPTDANGRPVACAGKPTVARTLYYWSNPGFSGSDRVVYETEHGMYVVNVMVQ